MASPFDSLFLGADHHFGSQDDFADFGDNLTNDLSFDSQPTVSPQDLWADDSIVMSAPPSTTFPNLSTPQTDYLDSPALTSGLNTTPMDDGSLDAQLNFTELESYAPLFPEESCDQFNAAGTPVIASNNSFDSLTDLRTSAQASPMVRQKSSPGRPPVTAASHLRKHSLSNGISKAQAKSRKTLPEISIDSEDDKETAKRKKNTAAARKSRQRKAEIMDAYATEIQRLRALVTSLGGNPDPPAGVDV